MSGVVYDVEMGAVRSVISQVDSAALSAGQQGRSAASEGDQISGLCGTSGSVAGAFSRLWASRSETGVRSGTYGQGCASALGQACAVISSGDSEMAEYASSAAGVAASASRFGVMEV